jgi:hypothetical protein
MNLDHYWTVTYKNSKGEVLWKEENLENTLANQGISSLLEYFYRGNAKYAPSNGFFVRLCNYVPQVTDTLASISSYEPSGNGYSAQLVTADKTATGFLNATSDVNGSTLTITSKTVTFTAAGGNIGPVTTAFVATSSDNSGKLISYLPLALTRTILNTDSMEYFWTTKEN